MLTKSLFNWYSMQTPQSHRLRIGRHSEPDTAYHLRFSCTRKSEDLSSLANARAVVQSLKREADAHRVSTHCFVVMPDHVHWLATLRSGLLGDAIARVKRYSRWRASGHIVWQRGFFDRAIRAEDSLIETARYIVANPLRAGLADTVMQYAHWDAEWVRPDWRMD